MARKRNNKRYSEEFKLEAVKLSEKVGVPKAAKDLGVDSKSIYNWIQQFSPSSKSKASSAAKSNAELEAENKRLKKENDYLTKINDVLKKSVSIFSNDSKGGFK
jgi:transposase